MRETWRAVVGYESKYEVSDLGNIRSKFRQQEFNARWGVAKMRFPAKIMLQSKTKAGYKYVSLSKDAVKKKHLVHRLVMRAFAGDSCGLQVNHKDGNKGNNALPNLEYCTPSENLSHATKILGTRRGEAFGTGKIKESDIKTIRADKRLLREIASEYGVTLQAIHLIKRKKNWGWVGD